MKDKETIFKEGIRNRLDIQIRNIGYKKHDEWKGFIKYECPNNYLKFVFEWNQTHNFYCILGFNQRKIIGWNWGNKFDYEYPLESIIQKLNNNKKTKETEFGKEFSLRIEEWVNETSNQILEYNIQEIKRKHPVIVQLRAEMNKETKKYNEEIELSQTKKEADKAWNSKDFKLFVEVMHRKTIELPPSYNKKLSIAIKKLEKENGA